MSTKKVFMLFIILSLVFCASSCSNDTEKKTAEEDKQSDITSTYIPETNNEIQINENSSSHKCTNCGNPATHNELSNIDEYYCDKCWEEMESLVEEIFESSSSHKCTNCGNPATHDELSNIDEYYCDECWEEMEDFMEQIFGN